MRNVPRCHAGRGLLLAVVALSVGCDDGDKASPVDSTTRAPKPNSFSIVEQLRGARENMRSQKGADPDVPRRIDAILATLDRDGPGAIRRAPAVFVAALNDDGYTPGADQLWVWVVGPALPIRRVEVLDESGSTVLAANERFRSYQTRDETLDLARAVANMHVVPSTWNPRPLEQAIDAARFEGLGRSDPLVLPPDLAAKRLLVRVVYDGGLQSSAVPIFRDVPPPPLATALAQVRARAADAPSYPDAAEAPPPEVERIDAALAALRRDAHSPLTRPRLLSAVMEKRGSTESGTHALFPGVESLSLAAVGPLSTRPSVEILDEQGTVIATYRGRTGIYYSAVDPSAGTGLIGIDLHVIPSIENPMPREKVIEAARASLQKFQNEAADAEREPLQLLELPPNWHRRQLSARLAFGDATRTAAVPIRRGSSLYLIPDR